MSDRKPSVILWVGGTVLVVSVLLAVYVGAYYWSVDIAPPPLARYAVYPKLEFEPDLNFEDRDWEQRMDASVASAEFWRHFFAPINWLDRHLRPGFWQR